jgi:hypothetical protein
MVTFAAINTGVSAHALPRSGADAAREINQSPYS